MINDGYSGTSIVLIAFTSTAIPYSTGASLSEHALA